MITSSMTFKKMYDHLYIIKFDKFIIKHDIIMKRSLLCMIIAVFSLTIQSKTTYIPLYNNKIILIEDGQIDSVWNRSRMLQLYSKDNLISCLIAQQVVSQELVKAIKRAKSEAGWAMVAAGMSSASAGFSRGQMNSGRVNGHTVSNYINSRELAKESFDASADATAHAEELKTLMVDLLVKNNSDKEMLITDMDRGLVWFILPHNEAVLPLAKGEECHFRVSSCSPLDENVKYINASANSILEKYTIGLETDMFWYVPISEKTKKEFGLDVPIKDGYIKIDKETMVMTTITPEEFKEIKASKLDQINVTGTKRIKYEKN